MARDQVAFQRVRNAVAVRADEIERQRSLSSVFEYSWKLLTKQEQLILTQLTVFQGNFTYPASEAVVNAHHRILADLAAKSLLGITPDGRYEMHSLLRSFAAEKIAQLQVKFVSVQTAHSFYYGNFLAAREPDISGPKEEHALNEISREINEIRAGWQWAVDRLGQAAVSPPEPSFDEIVSSLAQYLPMLTTFYQRRSWFREAKQVFSQARSTLHSAGFDTLEPGCRATFLFGLIHLSLAKFCLALGEKETARNLVLNGLQKISAFTPGEEAADAWHLLGQIDHQSGALETAQEAYQKSLMVSRDLRKETSIASNLISLGVLAKNRGDLAEAEGIYNECMTVFQRRSDSRGVWTCLINLGNIANVQQDFFKAKNLYDQAYTIVKDTKDSSRTALTLLNLGSVARETGEFSEALRCYTDSLNLSVEIGDKRIEIASLDGLGKTHLRQDRTDSAGDYFQIALRGAIDAGLMQQALDSMASLGRLNVKSGKPDLALSLLLFVTRHPGSPGHVRSEAQSDLDKLKAEISAEMMDRANAISGGLSIETLLEYVQSAARQS